MDTAPATLQLDNRPLPQLAWRYDPATRQVHATFAAAGFTLFIQRNP
jgi:hypothetical protein